MAELPTGTVTLLFTDIEGSTRLLQELGNDYAPLLEEPPPTGDPARALDAYCRAVVDVQGDGFFVAFARARRGARPPLPTRTRAVGGLPTALRVRMGVHTGPAPPRRRPATWASTSIAPHGSCAAANGGQVLLPPPGPAASSSRRRRPRATSASTGSAT